MAMQAVSVPAAGKDVNVRPPGQLDFPHPGLARRDTVCYNRCGRTGDVPMI